MLRFLLDEHISPAVCLIVRERRSEVVIESLVEWRGGGKRQTESEPVVRLQAVASLKAIRVAKGTFVILAGLFNYVQLAEMAIHNSALYDAAFHASAAAG